MLLVALLTASTLLGWGVVVAGRNRPQPIPVRVRQRRRPER